jgi:uncharacterized oxidoreductase
LLANFVQSNLPRMNVLINNAGIQRRVSLAAASWPEHQAEVDTLLSDPVHLNHLLVPGLLKHERPGLLVNVTSVARLFLRFSRQSTAHAKPRLTAIP